MYQRDASILLRIGNLIQAYYNNVPAMMMPSLEVTAAQREDFTNVLQVINASCAEMGLCQTQTVIESVISDYKNAAGQTQQHLRNAIAYIDRTLKSELKSRIFLQIDPRREWWMKTAEQFAKDPIFGAAVASSFSSAMYDAREAGICFATWRNTAAVFHCMRVAEKGLIALAGILNVPFKIPFEPENWANIIEPIEKQIREQEQTLPKGPIKADTLKFYSQAATQFFYFKNAWRNHVAHARENYGDEQTSLILDWSCPLN